MKNPFIAGNWVRGNNFFGREKLIKEILDGSRNYLWVAGTRRVGKTSLLKQIELLTQQDEYSKKYISFFWDMQGSRDLNGLRESLLESVEDVEERFSKIGVSIAELENEDLFAILRSLKRKAKDASLNLMILCDEAEELINVEKNDPEALPKLRRYFQRGDNIYTVLTSTKRLSILEQTSIPNTSPFLHGFVPPVYLTLLETDEAMRLISQWDFSEEVANDIIEKTNRHPYLIQLICGRLIDSGDLKQVIAEVSYDDMIARFFSVDFETLEAGEKEILLRLLQKEKLNIGGLQEFTREPEKLIKQLYGLMHLGFIKESDGDYSISNYFFAQWLEREKDKLYSDTTLKSEQTTRAPSKSVTTKNLPEIGESLGHHEILEKLGAGGMGHVFKARDVKLNRLVALKILPPELVSDEESKKRFILEAQAASTMNHPNICTIYQIDEDAGLNFISMEFVEGDNLRDWMLNQPDNISDKIHLATQTATGLAHAHSKGVMHRDIKPENIMVTREGIAKVTDFGLAKLIKSSDEHLTKAGSTLGTLSYMSPEQASGLTTDHRSDIFSLGIVLYEVLCGQLPFAGKYELSILYAILNEDPAPILEVNPELPNGIEKIVEKALQKDKEQRYQSMIELAADLQKIKY